ncbi:MAG: sodium:proton antiporter NhaD [Paludibacteraceae bacterium]|nr:sodium:proton antiporter NhaD [Paludibacteraceae bacterium]
MIVFMIILFLVGYFCIAMEHPFKVNKAASALLMAALLWTAYILYAPTFLPGVDEFREWMSSHPMGDMHDQVVSYVTNVQIIEHLGDTSEIIFFLLGAMTIVELVDVHGGFEVITRHITTREKRKLLWIVAVLAFFFSAILDNMTTSIVMIMLVRKLVAEQKDRWIFASTIIIAANAGGAWSPIGDVTTIMLWIKGNVTTTHLIPELLLPSLVAMTIPTLVLSMSLKGQLSASSDSNTGEFHNFTARGVISESERLTIFCMGVGALVFVPIFKSITHLPPFLGVLLGLGVLWVYTELLYHHKPEVDESRKGRISKVLSRVDISTLLFFLGILMSVAVLQCVGILTDFAEMLDKHIGSFYIIDLIIGVISSIVDNVPLVAAAMGMYPVATPADIAIDPMLSHMIADGQFWIFLAYCAGVGGSILIIGSAAGVVVMGIEKMDFIWYLKRISLVALAGYLAGAAFYILQMTFLAPLFGVGG